MIEPVEKGNIFGTAKQLRAMRSNFVPACWIVFASVCIAAMAISCSNGNHHRVEAPVAQGVVK